MLIFQRHCNLVCSLIVSLSNFAPDMKKTLLALIILSVGFTACNKEPVPLTKIQIQQKIDSITAYRIKELDEMARRDLEHRIKIEVKVKADSIIRAAQHNTADTTPKTKPVLN